jgi:hypothetical protein
LRNEQDTDKETLPKRYEVKRDWSKFFIMKNFKISTPPPNQKKFGEKISINNVGWVCGRYGGRRWTYKASVG